MKDLTSHAIAARQQAYAPYSKFRVGAALRLKNGHIVTGANVENCSYGLTICAERTAIGMAVMQGAKPGDIEAIAVAADSPEAIAPCGACRQVLAEFADPQTPVFLHNVRDQSVEQTTLGELLPMAFHARNLERV